MDIVKIASVGKDVAKVAYKAAVVLMAVSDRREAISNLCKDVVNAPAGKHRK